MFDYCKRKEIINDLSNAPKGFIKSKNYVEVECCEFADELKVPMTSSGYLLCSKHLTANGKEICRNCGIFRGFYGYCIDKGNIVKKKFELPEDDKFIASDNFNFFENGIKIGFVNGEFILSLSCKDFKSFYAEDTLINEYFQDSIVIDRCMDDAIEACEQGIAVLNELECDLKQKLKTIDQFKKRLARGMFNGQVSMTKEETDNLPSYTDSIDGTMYRLLYPEPMDEDTE